jgi:hypothetical protein
MSHVSPSPTPADWPVVVLGGFDQATNYSNCQHVTYTLYRHNQARGGGGDLELSP